MGHTVALNSRFWRFKGGRTVSNRVNSQNKPNLKKYPLTLSPWRTVRKPPCMRKFGKNVLNLNLLPNCPFLTVPLVPAMSGVSLYTIQGDPPAFSFSWLQLGRSLPGTPTHLLLYIGTVLGAEPLTDCALS